VEQITLIAEKKKDSGSGAAKRLRATGKVPGVVYGLGRETLEFAVDRRRLFEVLDRATGGNVLISLELAGAETDPDIAAIIKEIQWSPVHKEPLSVDLQWISLTETIIVSVPILVQGDAPGVEEGGSVNQLHYEAEVECLPTNIPQHLVIDITDMNIADTRHASDIAVPEGIKLLLDPDDAVVTVARPITDEDLEVRVDEELLEGELEALELEEGEVAPEDMEEEAEVEEGEEAEEGDEGEASEDEGSE